MDKEKKPYTHHHSNYKAAVVVITLLIVGLAMVLMISEQSAQTITGNAVGMEAITGMATAAPCKYVETPSGVTIECNSEQLKSAKYFKIEEKFYLQVGDQFFEIDEPLPSAEVRIKYDLSTDPSVQTYATIYDEKGKMYQEEKITYETKEPETGTTYFTSNGELLEEVPEVTEPGITRGPTPSTSRPEGLLGLKSATDGKTTATYENDKLIISVADTDGTTSQKITYYLRDAKTENVLCTTCPNNVVAVLPKADGTVYYYDPLTGQGIGKRNPSPPEGDGKLEDYKAISSFLGSEETKRAITEVRLEEYLTEYTSTASPILVLTGPRDESVEDLPPVQAKAYKVSYDKAASTVLINGEKYSYQGIPENVEISCDDCIDGKVLVKVDINGNTLYFSSGSGKPLGMIPKPQEEGVLEPVQSYTQTDPNLENPNIRAGISQLVTASAEQPSTTTHTTNAVYETGGGATIDLNGASPVGVISAGGQSYVKYTIKGQDYYCRGTYNIQNCNGLYQMSTDETSLVHIANKAKTKEEKAQDTRVATLLSSPQLKNSNANAAVVQEMIKRGMTNDQIVALLKSSTVAEVTYYFEEEKAVNTYAATNKKNYYIQPGGNVITACGTEISCTYDGNNFGVTGTFAANDGTAQKAIIYQEKGTFSLNSLNAPTRYYYIDSNTGEKVALDPKKNKFNPDTLYSADAKKADKDARDELKKDLENGEIEIKGEKKTQLLAQEKAYYEMYDQVKDANRNFLVGKLNGFLMEKFGNAFNQVPSRICRAVIHFDQRSEDGWLNIPHNTTTAGLSSAIIQNIRTVQIEGEKEEISETMFRYAYTIRLLADTSVEWETYLENSCNGKTTKEFFSDYGALSAGEYYLFHYAGSTGEDMIFVCGQDEGCVYDQACVHFKDEEEPHCVSLVHGAGFTTQTEGSDYGCTA